MASDNLKIIVENKIPFIKGVLEPYCTVEYLAPSEITPEAVKDADALVVRTRTKCDRELLEGSKVRLVCTATIGTDHLDIPWLEQNGIAWRNAPGCNAPAVGQYVFSSLMTLINRPIEQHTIGIVGAGHVGKIVESWARALDMRVLVCDPPRAREEGGEGFCDVDTIARESDIITFHTPLTHEGPDATYHLAGEDFFNKVRRAPIFINAARGPVADTAALIAALDRGAISHAVIDCWENEPDIDPVLLEKAVIATPHIAGYSAQGKVRATQTALDAISGFFGLPMLKASAPEPGKVPASVKVQEFVRSYNPAEDTAALKASPGDFEELRNNYRLRDEARGAKQD